MNKKINSYIYLFISFKTNKNINKNVLQSIFVDWHGEGGLINIFILNGKEKRLWYSRKQGMKKIFDLL